MDVLGQCTYDRDAFIRISDRRAPRRGRLSVVRHSASWIPFTSPTVMYPCVTSPSHFQIALTELKSSFCGVVVTRGSSSF